MRCVQPAIDLWLRQLDLLQENVDQLIDAEANEQDAAAVTRDLAAVKELLCASAGGLQACFVVYEFQVRRDSQTHRLRVRHLRVRLDTDQSSTVLHPLHSKTLVARSWLCSAKLRSIRIAAQC